MNVLIVSDIHLGDYPDYNYFDKSRLLQFQKLATRIVELGKNNNCTELWLAGDLLKVPNNRNYINHQFKRFMTEICKGFQSVRYILGQHDLDSKSNLQRIEDTLVGLLDIENLIYADKTIIESNGNLIGFMNWSPNQDTSWIQNKVDILIAHYTKSSLFGQDIDESKFDLMIHGDIHNSQVIGKFVSIGNPIQHDFSSQEEGTCILLNTDTKEWRRILIDEDHSRFLRMYRVTDRESSGFQSELIYNVFNPLKVKTTSNDVKILDWKSLSDLIKNLADEKELSEIHTEVVSVCIPYTEIDFNFKLKTLDIHGCRSIIDFHYEFTDNEIIGLIGNNGTGKSTIVKALKANFEDSRFIGQLKSDFTDHQRITVTLEYQNKIYSITKGSSYEFKINNEVKNYNRKSQFEEDVVNNLPFLRYTDLMFITSDVQNLASIFSSDRRIELISKFYRLDRVDAYNQTVINIYNDKLVDLTNLKLELSKLQGSLLIIQKRIDELTEYSELDLDSLNSELSSYQKLREDFDKYTLWESKFNLCLTREAQLKESISIINSRLNLNVEVEKDSLDKLKLKHSKLKELIEREQSRYLTLKNLLTRRDELMKSGTELSRVVESLKKGECPFYGGECDKAFKSDSDNLLKKKESELISMRKQYSDIEIELSSYTQEELSQSYFTSLILNLKSELSLLSDDIGISNNKLIQYEASKSHKDSELERLSAVQKEIEIESSLKPQKIQLPYNLKELEFEIISKINQKLSYDKEILSKIRTEELIESKSEEIKLLAGKLEKYLDYSRLTSRSGKIYEEVLKKLAEAFSGQTVKYEIDSGIRRNNQYIDFNSYFYVKGIWRSYHQLSDGQRTVCDLDFLNKLFSSRMGLVVMDESFKHLDDENSPKAASLLSEMNVNTLMIATLDSNFTECTRKVLLNLNDKAETIYEII